jgi:integrase
VSEAVSLEKGGLDLDERLVRVTGKGDKERIVPIGRQATEALRRYLARGRPHLDRRHRSEVFLNARGGPLTRSGAFLILRRLAAVAGLDPESVHPHLLRHSSRPICSRAAPTCAACRRCSGTPTSGRPSSTRTYPIAAGRSRTSGRTRMRSGAAGRGAADV